MVEHPQLAGLRQRKEELLEKNARLRAQIISEGPFITRTIRWADFGVQTARMFLERRHWAYGLVGLLTAFSWGSPQGRKAAEKAGKHIGKNAPGWLRKVGGLMGKVVMGWQVVQRVRKLWHSYQSSDAPRLASQD